MHLQRLFFSPFRLRSALSCLSSKGTGVISLRRWKGGGPGSSMSTSAPAAHTSTSQETLGSLTVRVLPALQDNYMYLVEDPVTREAAIVDPVDPERVLSAVKESGVNLTTILTTHHHWDHASGNEKMMSLVPGLKVCGNDSRIEALNNTVKHNQELKIGQLNVKCLETPCHTSGHICYYVTSPDLSNKAVFTGDTLFIGGCGKFFEGTAGQMYHALCEVLSSLPHDTLVFCGHEYAVSNLRYALHVEPHNSAISGKMEWAKAQRLKNLPTMPSSIGQELTFNPFMRVKEPDVMAHCSKTHPVDVMGCLREEKNNF